MLKARRWEYRDTGLTDVDWATGSIYSADSGVDRHYLIFNSSYNTIKIDTLSFRTFGLTCSFQNLAVAHNCVDHQSRIVSYLLTLFIHSSRLNCTFSWIQLGCHNRCHGVVMVGSLFSSSIVSPERPLHGASLSSLTGHGQVLLWLCSITICGQIGHIYIYSET